LDRTAYVVHRDHEQHTLLLLSTDWHLRDDTRIFFELGQHVAEDKNFPAGPNDQDQWDINQVFIDLSASLGGIDGRARVGRQYVVLGSSRLVGLRDGPNVRERFDGGRLTFTDNAGNTVEALALRDVLTSLGAFDDSSTHGDELWGVYAALKNLPQLRQTSIFIISALTGTILSMREALPMNGVTLLAHACGERKMAGTGIGKQSSKPVHLEMPVSPRGQRHQSRDTR
jgi:hypothetical protein